MFSGEGPGDDNSGLSHSGWSMVGRWFGSRQILALLLTRRADLGNREGDNHPKGCSVMTQCVYRALYPP